MNLKRGGEMRATLSKDGGAEGLALSPSDNEVLATRTGFEPVVSAVTGRRVNRYTNAPLNQTKGGEPPIPSAALTAGDRDNRSPLVGFADGSDQAIHSPALAISPRECDCPAWVIRCAHFPDGRYIGIRNPMLKVECGRCNPFNRGTWLFGGTFSMHYCSECGSPRWFRADRIYFEAFDSEADALAAFYAAEAELLRGEA